MTIDYKSLWNLLLDRNMSKTNMRKSRIQHAPACENEQERGCQYGNVKEDMHGARVWAGCIMRMSWNDETNVMNERKKWECSTYG